ncbi:MAG: hypothetical protein FWC96_04745 [Oscillospiraceae bacterium]|nr:hypothetical protein [Oscillospiraceae bacterium]
MRKKRCVIYAFLFTAVLLLISACASNPSNTAPVLLEPVAGRIDTAFVTRGVVEEVEILSGIARLPTAAAYTETGSGRIGGIYAWPGDIVYEGQVIARLDTSRIDAMIDNLERSMELSRTMHRLQAEELSVRINMLELAYSAAVADAERDVGYYEEYDTEYGEAAVGIAVDTAGLRGQIELLRIDLDHITRRHRLDAADSAIALAELREYLAQAEIRAPFAGEVVFTLLPGTWVNPLDPVAYISSPDGVFVEYVGMVLSPQTLQWNAERIHGTIGRRSYPLERIILSIEEQNYYRNRGLTLPIRFDIQAEPHNLPSSGETVFIRLYSIWTEDVLRIPSNALFQSGADSAFVYRIIDGRQEHVYVTIGALTDIYTEILYGLNEGDEVFVRP